MNTQCAQMTWRWRHLCHIVAFVICLLFHMLAHSTVINVNTLSDEMNSYGDCSLREALAAASSNIAQDGCPAGQSTEMDIIKLPPGSINISLSTFVIDESVTIEGDPATKTELNRNGGSEQFFRIEAGSVFFDSLILTNSLTDVFGTVQIANGAVVTLTNSTITGNGSLSCLGGGLYVAGDLTVSNSVIENNEAYRGGGINVAGGRVWLNSSSVLSNLAKVEGGGIYAGTGSLYVESSEISSNSLVMEGVGAGISSLFWTEIRDSTISNNNASVLGIGGGIYIRGGWVEIYRSTFSGNTADEGAAVLIGDSHNISGSSFVHMENVTVSENYAHWNQSASIQVFEDQTQLFMYNCTVAKNTADANGGIKVYQGEVFLFGVVLAENTGANCYTYNGTIQSGGYNLEDGNSCGFSEVGDLSNVNPLLSDLAFHGGPTMTCIPNLGSPAIDSIPDGLGAVPSTDQRGVARPQDGNNDGGWLDDRGAVEVEGPFFADSFETGDTSMWSDVAP